MVEAAGAREQRQRVLPAWLTVYLVLGLALFMDRGAGRVMRKLAGTLAWAERGVAVRDAVGGGAVAMPGRGWAPAPLRLLFEKVAGPLAAPGAAGAWWRGLRLVSLDGTTLDAQDERGELGSGSAGRRRRRRSGRAAGRVPAGAAAGAGRVRTRALVAAVWAATARVRSPWPGCCCGRLSGRDAVPGGRGTSPARSCGATPRRPGRSCCGGRRAVPLPVDEILADGTYLSRLKAPRKLRRRARQTSRCGSSSTGWKTTAAASPKRHLDHHAARMPTRSRPASWRSCTRPGGRSRPRWAR